MLFAHFMCSTFVNMFSHFQNYFESDGQIKRKQKEKL